MVEKNKLYFCKKDRTQNHFIVQFNNAQLRQQGSASGHLAAAIFRRPWPRVRKGHMRFVFLICAYPIQRFRLQSGIRSIPPTFVESKNTMGDGIFHLVKRNIFTTCLPTPKKKQYFRVKVGDLKIIVGRFLWMIIPSCFCLHLNLLEICFCRSAGWIPWGCCCSPRMMQVLSSFGSNALGKGTIGEGGTLWRVRQVRCQRYGGTVH